MFERSLKLPISGKHSFFLWGQRKSGKTPWIDLLRSEEFRKFASRPEQLREEVSSLPKGSWVVVDEIQKVPALLDSIHSLIESHGVRFALSGSSVRKLKRGHANLLGGGLFATNSTV